MDPYVVKMPGNTQHIANSRNFIQPLSLAAKMQQNRNRKHRNLLVMNLGTLILVKFPIQRKQENLHCHPQFLNSFNYVFFMAPENLQSSFARKRQPSVSRSQHIDLPSNWKWILRANDHRYTMIHIYDLATCKYKLRVAVLNPKNKVLKLPLQAMLLYTGMEKDAGPDISVRDISLSNGASSRSILPSLAIWASRGWRMKSGGAQ